MATPTVYFTSDKTHGIPGTDVTFYNESTYQPESTFWDFGDGETSAFSSYQYSFVHEYTSAGSYDVTLSAWDFCAGSWETTYWDYVLGVSVTNAKPPLSATELGYITISSPGSLSGMDLLIYTAASGSNVSMSILEKVNRLTELHDPDLIDLEYIQYFANNLGYNVNVNRSQFGNGGTDANSEEELNRYLRFMVRNLPSWYKIKTTRT